jgi:hypothetical protein
MKRKLQTQNKKNKKRKEKYLGYFKKSSHIHVLILTLYQINQKIQPL